MTTRGVVLNVETKLAAVLLAEASLQKYSKVFGHYRNTANSHLVGRLGEFAAYHQLRKMRLKPVANFININNDRVCDIDSRIGRIEVKTWSAAHWENWGRCVSVAQYHSIQRKTDLILWCVAYDVDSDNPRIEFKGWNEVSDLLTMKPKMTGAEGRQIHNYQFEESQLNPMKTLRGRK